MVKYCLELYNLIGGASFTAILAGFSRSMIISPTCSGVPSYDSINKAKTGTEVVSLLRTYKLQLLYMVAGYLRLYLHFPFVLTGSFYL